MANGRKEPWEQLGYIAGTGSRVVTQDPLSAITEAGADNFWKWLNNQTAYAKAAEQTEQAQKHQLERDKTQSKDAFKLQKSEGLQRLSEIEFRRTARRDKRRRGRDIRNLFMLAFTQNSRNWAPLFRWRTRI